MPSVFESIVFVFWGCQEMLLLLIGVACHLDSPILLWPYWIPVARHWHRSSHTTLVFFHRCQERLTDIEKEEGEGDGKKENEEDPEEEDHSYVVPVPHIFGGDNVGYLFLKWGTNTLAKMSRWQMMLVWNGSLLTSTTRSELFKQWIYELEHKYWGLDVTHGIMRSCSY